MNKLALLLALLLLSLSAPVFAQSSGLPSTVPGTVGNCVKIGTNNVATDNGSLCGTGGSSATGYGYTFRLSAGTYFAHNDATGVDDFSGTDAAVVIRSAIANNAAVCGHLKFAPAIYNLNSLVAETTTGFTNSYAIGFPGNTGTATQFCQWFVEGDSAPDLRDEFGDPVQTSGVIFYVTPTAVASVASTVMIDDLWARPDPSLSGVAGSVWIKNVDLRFPTNQRGNETASDMTQASNANYENVIADTNVAGASLAFPVAGTLGMYGLTSTNSVHEENYFKNAYAIGYDTSFDIQSEHTVMVNSYGLNTNFCINYGVRGSAINHASSWINPGCGEAIHGITLGANVAAGTLLNITGFDMEDLTSGIWQPVTYHMKETNSGNSYGVISYTRDLAGTQTALTNLFDGGGGTAFSITSPFNTLIQGTAADDIAKPKFRIKDNSAASTGGNHEFQFLNPLLPAGGFMESFMGVSDGTTFSNNDLSVWGFWKVGAGNACNATFFGTYSGYPLTVTSAGVGIGVPLGTCPNNTLQVVGDAAANSFSGSAASVTYTNGAAAGTSPGAATCLSGTVCDSFSGHFTLTVGTATTTGNVVAVNFPTTRALSPSCTVRVNLVASPYTELPGTYSTNTTTLNFFVGTAPTASTQYEFTYMCGGK